VSIVSGEDHVLLYRGKITVSCSISGTSGGSGVIPKCCWQIHLILDDGYIHYNFTFTDYYNVSGTWYNNYLDNGTFNGVKIQDYELTTTTTSIETTSSTSSIPSSTSSSISGTTSSVNISTTTMPGATTTTSTILVTTSVNPTTTTSIDNGCPPDYPVDCGNGWCCPLDFPVCGRGFNNGSCFEAGTNPNCPASTLYGEDSYEVEQLRFFRDNILNQTPEGRELIKLYYIWSPVIVKAMEEDKEFKEEVKQMIDGVLPMIEKDILIQ